MIRPAEVRDKVSAGHFTNLTKLQIYAAFTLYSIDRSPGPAERRAGEKGRLDARIRQMRIPVTAFRRLECPPEFHKDATWD
jgi:hypothetical protein